MKNQKGFTLVEILVVIVILGILLAVVVPKYGGFTRNAEINSTEVDIRTMKSSLQQHFIDNKDKDLLLEDLNRLLDFEVELSPGALETDNPAKYQTVIKEDSWGRPYYVYVSNDNDIYVAFYSFGPDGIKSNNSADPGDDIIMIFYPTIQ